MKTKIILTLSLGFNLLLAAAYVFKTPQSANRIEPGREVLFATNPSPPVIETIRTNVVTLVTPAAPFDWRVVESEDYKKYIANLRSIGCPEKTICDIILADVNNLYRQRVKANMGTTNRYEYWKSGSLLRGLFDEKQQELVKEKRELLKTLLGDNYSGQTDSSTDQIISPMEQMTGDFLTAEKQSAMKQLEAKYAGRWVKAITSDDNQAVKNVQAEKDAEILAVLSPEEKFEYDLRLSPTAMFLRLGMGDFEPTEQEFRGMFKAMKQFTDQFGVQTQPGDTGPEQEAAGNRMLDEFKAVLGEERYQQFQQHRPGGAKQPK